MVDAVDDIVDEVVDVPSVVVAVLSSLQVSWRIPVNMCKRSAVLILICIMTTSNFFQTGQLYPAKNIQTLLDIRYL